MTRAALIPDPAGTVSHEAVLSWDADGVVRLTGLAVFERALLTVGSEQSAIRHARQVYGLNVREARLLVKVVREGTADDGAASESQP